jgi:hypothetical protein
VKDHGAVALDLVRELDLEACAVDEVGELGAALLDRAVAEIFAVEVQEIECTSCASGACWRASAA